MRGDELAPGKMESLDSIPSEMKARYYVTFRLPTGGKPGDRTGSRSAPTDRT